MTIGEKENPKYFCWKPQTGSARLSDKDQLEPQFKKVLEYIVSSNHASKTFLVWQSM